MYIIYIYICGKYIQYTSVRLSIIQIHPTIVQPFLYHLLSTLCALLGDLRTAASVQNLTKPGFWDDIIVPNEQNIANGKLQFDCVIFSRFSSASMPTFDWKCVCVLKHALMFIYKVNIASPLLDMVKRAPVRTFAMFFSWACHHVENHTSKGYLTPGKHSLFTQAMPLNL